MEGTDFDQSASKLFSAKVNLGAPAPLEPASCPKTNALNAASDSASNRNRDDENGSANTSVTFSGSPSTCCDASASAFSPVTSQPSGMTSFATEIYIAPPSISLGRSQRSEKEKLPSCEVDKTDVRSVDAAVADTKAALADRRSTFFSQVTPCPIVLPSSMSHSSILNFQPAANVTDPTKQTSKEVGGNQDVAANGHLGAVPTLAKLCREKDSSSQELVFNVTDPKNDALPTHRSVSDPVVVIHQAAPPPDTTDVLPLTLLPNANQIVLQVDESLPLYCARMEPSPERFWGPSVAPFAPLRSNNHNLQLRGGELNQARLGGSTGQLETLVDRHSGDSCRLGTPSSSSSVPSPQESPLLKSASKEPSSSTSTDSLPSTPSSANLSSHSKGGNLEKLRTFFGDNSPKISDSKSEQLYGELSPDTLVDDILSETKKIDLQKMPVIFDSGGKSSSSSSDRSFKNKKGGWSLSGKAHGTRSPGAKPKKGMERGGESGESLKQKQTWKGKMARTILRYGSGPILANADAGGRMETLGVIGVPLENCSPSPFNELVPLLVSACTHVVEERGIQNQGIYRVPGNTGAINQLIEEMIKDPVGLCLESEKWSDVNLVSSLLKLFFRKLPDSLITDELYESVIDANRLDNSTRRMLKLKKLLHELPEHNFETFHFLAQHLSRVASHEDVNKMDARNLAIVFGPTLVRPQDNNMVNMVRDMTDQCRIIESIILHCEWFFGSWDEDVNVPVDDDPDELAPISGMNDELLAKAESLALTHHVSNKDVIQMIVKAANKKLRNLSKAKATGSMGNLDLDENSSPSTSASKADFKIDLDSPPICNALSEEMLLEVKKYPAYHFEEMSYLSTENAKSHVRRAHSNDFLSDSPRCFYGNASKAFCGNSSYVLSGDQKGRSMPRNFSETLKLSTSSEELDEPNGVVKSNSYFDSRRFAT